MDENNKVDNTEEVVPTTTEEQVPSQEVDPVKAELDRVDEKPKRSKKEQLLYTKRRVEQQLKEMGETVEPEKDDSEEDRPLTVKEFNRLSAERELTNAVTLADQIEDENERRLTQHYLENVIKPSGDAKTDLRNAQLMVNAVKNGQIAEEAVRTAKVRTTTTSPSAPPKDKAAEPELSKEDEAIKRGFGLSPEEVQKAIGS